MPCVDTSVMGGYAVDETEIVFWGQCPDCRQVHADSVARSC
jgi:Fur family ferric uptake transcriptional regulator